MNENWRRAALVANVIVQPPGQFFIRAAVDPFGIAVVCTQKGHEDLASLHNAENLLEALLAYAGVNQAQVNVVRLLQQPAKGLRLVNAGSGTPSRAC